jgi:hypothetical protein
MRSASGAGDTAIQLSFLKTVVLLVGNNLPSTLSACNNPEQQVARNFVPQRVAQTCFTGLRLFLLKEPRTYKSGLMA